MYQKASILSLDVAAGAVCCSAMFARQMHVTTPWQTYFVLGGSVWLIYTLDHLLDAFHKPLLLTPRHRFHQQHWKMLLGVSLLLLMATAWLAFTQLPGLLIRFGVLVGFCLLVYLVITHFLPIPYFFKEGWVAVLYTAGVWGSVAAQALVIRQIDWLTGLAFSVILLQQAMMLAWYETEDDTRQQMLSLVQQRASHQLHSWLKILIFAGIAVLVAGFAFFSDTILDRSVWLTLAGIAGVWAAITWFPAFFRPHYLYRLLSDGMLLLPAWVLFLDTA